ncbi:MAG: GntR family transcriptional regulator [Muribaculaceae bacterium]|nr:GntR family transcriptional regulator [Muribaculaceae bacterium]
MFNENGKAIYLQIVDFICEEILAGKLSAGERLPSVREYAARMQVNPNTMMRSYEYLASRDIIFNSRGIGYFLGEKARDIVSRMKRDELLGKEINDIFRRLNLLDVSPELLKEYYEKYLESL